MNTADVIAYGNDLIESAFDARRRLLHLIERAERIGKWLQAYDIYPIEWTIRPHARGVGFQLVYLFSVEYLVPFAAMEREFWSSVDELIPVDEDLMRHVRNQQPLAGVNMDEHVWELVITPCPSTDEFPDRDFWKTAAPAVASMEQKRKKALYGQRVSEIHAVFARARQCHDVEEAPMPQCA